MTAVAVYCRISKDRAGAGLGVSRQEEDCRTLAKQKGWQVAGVFVDNDLSASQGRTRPQYERLLAALEDGSVDAVLAWHPDRLHRSTVELERFIDVIERTKAKVATVQAGELDLSTAAGRMTARVVGAVARHEVEHKGERQRRKHEELARAGKQAGGGSRPYGFEADRVTINRPEAKVIREMAKRILAGDTVRGVAADLNRRGVPTVTGAAWSMPVVRRLLIAPRTAGLREYRGKIVAEAEWKPIISRTDHERLVRLLSDPSRRTNRNPRRYLLTGLAACALCGAKLVARPRDDKSRCYVCASGPSFRGCGKIRVLAEPFEELIVEMVVSLLDTPELAARIAASHSDETVDVDEIVDLERRLDELAVDWADGVIDRRSWLAARTRIESNLEDLRRQLATSAQATPLDGYIGRPGALARAWSDLGFDRQRAIVTTVLDRVDVSPAVRGRNRFDPDRITPIWRF